MGGGGGTVLEEQEAQRLSEGLLTDWFTAWLTDSAPVQCQVYLVEDVLMNFLLGILEGGGSVEEHPLIQHLLDLFWLLMEVCLSVRLPVCPPVCPSLCLEM